MKEIKILEVDTSLASEAGKKLNELRNKKLSKERRSEIAKIAVMSTKRYIEKKERERIE